MPSSTFAIFLRVMKSRRTGLVGWSLALVAVCLVYVGVYPWMDTMDLEALVDGLPPGLMDALGYDDMTTADGYIGSAVFGMLGLILLLVFAVMNGARLIASDEEDGVLELEFASPLSRTAIYLQRAAALWAQLTILVGVVFVATTAVALVASLDVDVARLATASVSLWLAVGLYASATFAAGAATGRRGAALGVGSGFAVVSYMMNAVGPTVDQAWMARVSPLGWYMVDNPVTRGFHFDDAALLAASSLVALVLGWSRFVRRDLMT